MNKFIDFLNKEYFITDSIKVLYCINSFCYNDFSFTYFLLKVVKK